MQMGMTDHKRLAGHRQPCEMRCRAQRYPPLRNAHGARTVLRLAHLVVERQGGHCRAQPLLCLFSSAVAIGWCFPGACTAGGGFRAPQVAQRAEADERLTAEASPPTAHSLP